MKKRTKQNIFIAVFALVIVAAGVIYGGIPAKILNRHNATPTVTTTPTTFPATSLPEEHTEVPESSELSVQFIDVGQADSALLQADGQTMLIDGGNVADSDVIASVLKRNNIDYIDYVVCTHAHEDHVGGLSGALSVADAGMVYAPETTSDSKAYTNFIKKVSAQGLTVIHPQPLDEIQFGNGKVVFLGPVRENYEDINNTSIVLKVIYGDTSFLFTGDLEREGEFDIASKGYNLEADVLKVGHHGSSSSTTYPFLREIMPKYAVISCGKDNSYGHPDESTLSRLRDAGVTVYRTDEQGDIFMTSDGHNITVKKR